MIANGLKLDDIDMLIPHQANLRINTMVGQMIGLPPEKMHNNIQKYGNTTAATIPICMHEAVELGKDPAGPPGLPRRVRRRPHVGLGVPALLAYALTPRRSRRSRRSRR